MSQVLNFALSLLPLLLNIGPVSPSGLSNQQKAIVNKKMSKMPKPNRNNCSNLDRALLATALGGSFTEWSALVLKVVGDNTNLKTNPKIINAIQLGGNTQKNLALLYYVVKNWAKLGC